MNLVDLKQKIEECRLNYDHLSYSTDIQLDEKLAKYLSAALQEVDPKTQYTIHPFSIEFQSNDGLRAYLPSSSLWFGKCFWSLSTEFDKYKSVLEQIKIKISEYGITNTQLKPFLKNLPSNGYHTAQDNIAQKFRQCVDEVILSQTDKDLFLKFLTDKSWWFRSVRNSEAAFGKTLERGDVYDSSLALACRVIVANSAKLLSIIKAFKHSSNLRSYFNTLSIQQFTFQNHSSSAIDKVGENVIYYGAPGVGKSYKIDQLCNKENSIRTIFHPDTQNSDFVGCLKPKMNGSDVVYEFRAGPFTKAIIKSFENSKKHIYLVIEEINRAASAAVFGEIFQLLDRDDNGQSVYPIDLTDPDMLEYIESKVPGAIENGQLRIPSNLSLFATMNSSDQAVMPMDTAFKRRWIFEYVSIDFNECPQGNLTIPIRDQGEVTVSWANFAKIINSSLEAKSIPEDRLLGPWFLSKSELSTTERAQKALTGKLCLYLWDDVLRHGQHNIIYNNDIKNYGQLVSSFNPKSSVFSENIEQALVAQSINDSTEESKITEETTEE